MRPGGAGAVWWAGGALLRGKRCPCAHGGVLARRVAAGWPSVVCGRSVEWDVVADVDPLGAASRATLRRVTPWS